MIEFEFEGIRIGATAEAQPLDYLDGDGRKKTRFDKAVHVFVDFWDFRINRGNLFELATIKSVLQLFIQSSLRRSSKEAPKIELEKKLCQEGYNENLDLCFVVRQKSNINYLHIFLKKDGNKVDEVYLDTQEAMMLEIALNKAISLLAPKFSDRDLGPFG